MLAFRRELAALGMDRWAGKVRRNHRFSPGVHKRVGIAVKQEVGLISSNIKWGQTLLLEILMKPQVGEKQVDQ